MIDFYCPICGRKMQTEEKHAGKTCACKNCGRDLVIPRAVVVKVDVRVPEQSPLDAIKAVEARSAERVPKPPVDRVATLERRLRAMMIAGTAGAVIAVVGIGWALTGGDEAPGLAAIDETTSSHDAPVAAEPVVPETAFDDPRVVELMRELARMQASVSKETGGRFIWDKQERPYAVIDYTQKDYVAGGVQHRTVRAVLPSPDTESDAEAAAKEIYEHLKADIESVQPDAQHKRINILLYDSFADGKAYDGSQIIHASTTAGPVIPAWDGASVNWKWRDPEHRPTSGQLAVFHDYWSGRDYCNKIAEAPYRDKDGSFIGTSDDQPDIDRRYANEKRKLVNRLLKLHGLSRSEFSNQLATVFLWRQGQTPSKESVAETAQSFREEWSLE